MRRHSFTKYTPSGWVFDPIATEKSWERATVSSGVVYWSSNNNVPDEEILRDFLLIGKIFDLEASLKKREEQVSSFLSEYRKKMETYEHSPEEIDEMRSAFGPGATVVNVVTGKKTKL